jgi:hypothetical protein
MDKGLKERLESLINYPLGLTQFKDEWKKLPDECGIADHPSIVALWLKRDRWIAAYFKGIYCGSTSGSSTDVEHHHRRMASSSAPNLS